jgi:hypothetical protein
VAAGKGYDDGANHVRLRVKGEHSAIRSHEQRREKKEKHNEVWLALRATPEDEQGGRERHQIERQFGVGKQGHGLGRCRYLGLARHAIQAFLTALSPNLKRIVDVLAGVDFNGRASAAGRTRGSRSQPGGRRDLKEASQPKRRVAKRAPALRGDGISQSEWRGRRSTSPSFPRRVFFHALWSPEWSHSGRHDTPAGFEEVPAPPEGAALGAVR